MTVHDARERHQTHTRSFLPGGLVLCSSGAGTLLVGMFTETVFVMYISTPFRAFSAICTVPLENAVFYNI